MGCLKNNPVSATRYRHLTSREVNRLKPTQAQTIVAAAILRRLYPVVSTGQAWDPDIASTPYAAGQPCGGSLRRNPIRTRTSRVTSQDGASLPRH